MEWFKNKNIPKLPDIEEISTEVPAVSQYLEAYILPRAFKDAGIDTLPVIDLNGYITGIVSEYDLAKTLPSWIAEEDSHRYNVRVDDIMTKNVWVETEHTSIEELLSKLDRMHTRVIPIIDNQRKYTGDSITRNALISFLTKIVKPISIGGLATPLGVYMTDGIHQAGSGNLGLITTGFALAFIVIIVQLIIGFVLNFDHNPVLNAFRTNYALNIILQLGLFLLILRLTPLVKYHAAEHQTIHAIEKGLPLSPEIVKMQPRPHKRCGTNIMVLLIGLQLIILTFFEIARFGPFLQFIFLVFGFLFTFSNWQKIGMWLQQYVTTKQASDSQIRNGIKAGEELLKKYKQDPKAYSPSFLQKIWGMGIIQILGSFLLMLWIFNSILYFI